MNDGDESEKSYYTLLLIIIAWALGFAVTLLFEPLVQENFPSPDTQILFGILAVFIIFAGYHYLSVKKLKEVYEKKFSEVSKQNEERISDIRNNVKDILKAVERRIPVAEISESEEISYRNSAHIVKDISKKQICVVGGVSANPYKKYLRDYLVSILTRLKRAKENAEDFLYCRYAYFALGGDKKYKYFWLRYNIKLLKNYPNHYILHFSDGSKQMLSFQVIDQEILDLAITSIEIDQRIKRVEDIEYPSLIIKDKKVGSIFHKFFKDFYWKEAKKNTTIDEIEEKLKKIDLSDTEINEIENILNDMFAKAGL